jgi:hypothetical protein
MNRSNLGIIDLSMLLDNKAKEPFPSESGFGTTYYYIFVHCFRK